MAGVSNIKHMENKYLSLGKWKCPNSPSGAHHSHEVSREGGYGLFVCKYCGNVQKLPTDFPTAMKVMGKNPSDPVTGGID